MPGQRETRRNRPPSCVIAVLLLFVGSTLFAIEHAVNLAIDSDENTTNITVRNAWPDAPEFTYTLVPRGVAQPDVARERTSTIPTPVRRLISLSTPNIPFLRDIGVLETLVGVDKGEYVYDAQVRRAIATGEIGTVGTGASLDLERVLELRPDLVLVSALGPDDPTVARLRGADIPVIVVADWRETTPLGRAEWIRLFGALYQEDRRAQELFQDRANRYDEIRERVSTEIGPDRRPTVFTNGPWQGQWPVPAGDSYMAQLFADAGARYLWAETEGTGSVFLDLEAVIARAIEADYWVNLNYDWTSRADARRTDPRLSAFSAYRKNNMFHPIKRTRDGVAGANDFWESGVGRPDIVLADLVSIFHQDIVPDHEPVYYRRIDP